MAFKMKGWSGNQSPIKQKTSFADIQKNISNVLSNIRPKTIEYDKTTKKSTSGFGLTLDEKKAAKKSGMSEWQWKTSKSKSGTRANKWVTTEGDDKSYMITDNSVKTKDKNSGKVVENFNTKSTNYQNVSEKIDNIVKKEESQSEIQFEGNIPENVMDFLQEEISSNQRYVKKEENDYLLDNQNPSIAFMYENNIDLIKSDPLAYLNKKLAEFEEGYKEMQEDEYEHNDDYFVDEITELKSLINELKNE